MGTDTETIETREYEAMWWKEGGGRSNNPISFHGLIFLADGPGAPTVELRAKSWPEMIEAVEALGMTGLSLTEDEVREPFAASATPKAGDVRAVFTAVRAVLDVRDVWITDGMDGHMVAMVDALAALNEAVNGVTR